MIQVPGKIFIFGEYSVMRGGEAVVAAVNPSFQCSWDLSKKFHPESPAGRFLTVNNTQAFLSVGGGMGPGFGSSTAELIASNEYLPHPWNDQKLWCWYREHFFPASGADLAVQMKSRKQGAGLYHFQIYNADYRMDKIEVPYLMQSNCLVFHCPPTQKIPTYSDLENRKDTVVDNRIADAFVHRWLKTFDASVLNEWADYLASLGFESLFGHEVRKAFQSVVGVSGVKGCGAGLNDVFLVCINQDQPSLTLKAIQQVAEKFHLTPMGNLNEHF